jgi:secreted Zn-dependent insulinase-like peptidase
MAHLFQRLLEDSLTEYTYPALLAGLGYQLSVAPAGFRLGVWGYSDKQLTLLDTVLERFSTLKIDPERFVINQRELERNWRNFASERPYQQAYSALPNLLLSTSWSPEALADAITSITVKDLEAWRSTRLQDFSILGLSHGNLNEQQLQQVAAHLREHLQLKDFEIAQPEVVQVDKDYLLALDVDHDDAAIVLYAQDSQASYAQRARSALAAQMLRQQYFTALRTERQLGYVVSVTNQTLRNQGGLAFIIQSPVASAKELELATREFMTTQLPVLEAMSAAEFAQHKEGLISRLTERDQNLRDRTSRYLADLDAGETSFDSQQQIAEIVADLTKAQMLEFYRELVAKMADRRVLIYTQGRFSEVPQQGVRLANAAALKTTSGR